MFKICKVEKEIGGKTLAIETGKIGRQAHGAVIVSCGETMVLVSATTAAPKSEDIDYFPLSVDYREKLSAAGKFPGGFMKREGRPSTKEILTARMIDRPIRPLFPDGYFNEVQILVTVLSADKENDPDVLAMIGASAALHISKIPFMGPLGACRLSRVDGKFVFNPTYAQKDKSEFNLVLGGRKEAINMIEVDSKQVSEDIASEGVAVAHKYVGELCDLIDELRSKCGVEKEIPEIESIAPIADDIRPLVTDKLGEAYQIKIKADRSAAIKEIKDEIAPQFCEGEGDLEAKCSTTTFNRAFDIVEREVVRKLIMEGKRPDGRAYDQIRDIDCEIGLLPRSHGSALFTRGETQALVSVTLGTGRDEQTVDGLLDEFGQDFMLHYNFPPFSVGEVRFVRGPGRREIGHGALAEKALEQVKPEKEDFPYTIKIVSDITESNGSSSQATICGGTLAMMEAGIPIKGPVAGISIGMVSDGDKYELLTDILGDEDHFGDMDFKVAGTKDGITAIQLDIKAEGLPHNIMVEALERAKTARLAILDTMNKVIDKPREQLSKYAPKIISIKIDPELIGKIIGPGGKVIKGIQEQTGATIEIDDDGTVCFSCVGGNGHLEAKEIVESMTTPPKVGKIYANSKVVSVKDFGAFVEISPGVEGLCHISELSDGYIKNVEDVCKMGETIPVKLLSIDDQGRYKLSRKAALIELGQSDQKQPAEAN
ncbi:MAG: polyribonucleotide nucleotidyltransferase [Sedimentisphaerales bacterium]|nr:polyribonucleotide nucleotidyltransferase [Sedimentisphaerales bacterium]